MTSAERQPRSRAGIFTVFPTELGFLLCFALNLTVWGKNQAEAAEVDPAGWALWSTMELGCSFSGGEEEPHAPLTENNDNPEIRRTKWPISSCYQQDTTPKHALLGKPRHGELACKFPGNKQQDAKGAGLWRGFWSSPAQTPPGS